MRYRVVAYDTYFQGLRDGEDVWDLLAYGARAAPGGTVLLLDGPACITDESQRRHLPVEPADDAAVRTGAELLAVIKS